MQKDLEPDVEERARQVMYADRAWRALRYIQQHPDEWEQANWHCGTTWCFAGHVVRMAGGQWGPEPPWGYSLRGWVLEPDPNFPADGTVPCRASTLLGLDVPTAMNLFLGHLRFGQLRYRVRKLFGPEPKLLPTGD